MSTYRKSIRLPAAIFMSDLYLNDVESNWNNFKQAISNTIIIHIPQKPAQSINNLPWIIPSIMHLSSHPTYPGRAWVGIIGDLQESFDKFPPLGTILCSKSPTFCIYRDSKNNENSWTNAPTLGSKYADKSLQIPTHYPTLGKWGLTMIGA